MPEKVSPQEREIFSQVYRYFEANCTPPANQEEDAVSWWTTATKVAGEMSAKWMNHKLMDALLMAVIEYMEFKAKEKTKELEEFVF